MAVLRCTIRRPVHLIAAWASEWAHLPLRLAGRLVAPGQPVPPHAWRKVLLLGADHIGDVLWLTASLPALKRGLPKARLVMTVSGPAAQVVENNPYVDDIVRMPPAARGAEAIAALRTVHADAAICYDTGAYVQSLQRVLRAGIPNRIAYVHKGFSAWVTHPVAIQFPQPHPAYFRDLVAQVTGTAPDWPLRPQVFPVPSDDREAANLWAELRLTDDRPVLACFVTSRQVAGAWPSDVFGRILAVAQAQCPVQLVLMGATGEAPMLAELKVRHRLSAEIAAGRLNLRALSVFLRRCNLVLAADSGPRHVANAAGVPVTFIRNLWARHIETGAYLDTETDLAPDLAEVDPGDASKWQRLLDPEYAATRIISLLGSAPRPQPSGFQPALE